jgi:pyruvate ferredoxin oxidoreductase alpha subunit
VIHNRAFISGDDAVAIGVKLAKPDVIAAYPITPQTIIVEKLSEFVEDGSLKSEYIHVESEHSAIMAALGSSSLGSRTFTATSSQGLLYMAEGLPYISGSRLPVVMVNANRAVAVPWSIYNDHNDSMFFLNSGWIHLHVEDAQEALDMVLQSFRIAEDPSVMTPMMINVDGFILTHTYEVVDVPDQKLVDRFLPPYITDHKMSLDRPSSLSIGVGPDLHTEFCYRQHHDFEHISEVISETDREFSEIFGRSYGGLTEKYFCDDAEVIMVTVGSITSTARVAVDELRAAGQKVGLIKLRYLRPFPIQDFLSLSGSVKSIGVLDKNISYGFEGTVFTNVNSALSRQRRSIPTLNFIAGLGGRDISVGDIREMYQELYALDGNQEQERVRFVNLNLKEGQKENGK